MDRSVKSTLRDCSTIKKEGDADRRDSFFLFRHQRDLIMVKLGDTANRERK